MNFIDWSESSISRLVPFLQENYMIGIEFSLFYSKEMLEWLLFFPDWNPKLLVSLTLNQNTIGFIAGHMIQMNIGKVLLVNLLCVHQEHRKKGIAPMLIKEITQRANSLGCFQAIYTGANDELPNRATTKQYNHFLLNPEKLIGLGFAEDSLDFTLKTDLILEKILPVDFNSLKTLVSKIFSKYSVFPLYTDKQLKWLFFSKFVTCYLNDDKLVSFFSLPLVTPYGETIKVAYQYYSTPEAIPFGIIKAKELGYDVFNSLETNGVSGFLKGTGSLHYYSFPNKCSESIGLILM